jgi:diguanylate cyclase (GGDEF)-like protein/PAS domain S-box-containing protein
MLLGLTEAERFARELLLHAPDAAAFVFDTQTRLRFADGGIMRRLGFRSEEVVGRTPAEVLPGPMWERLKPLYERTLAGDAYITGYETTSGRKYRMHGSPVVDETGRVTGGMLVSHEVLTPAEERLTERLRQQSAVAALGKFAVTGGVELGALIEEAARLIAETLRTDGVAVVELVTGRDEFLVRHESSGRLTGRRVPLDGSLAEAVLRTRGSVIIADSHKGTHPLSAPLLAMGVRSAVCVPIGHVDRPFGMLAAFSRHMDAFTADDANFLESVAFVLAEAAQRERVDAELRRQALHDVVTGLPNRTLLDDRLQQSLAVARRAGLRVGVLFVDIDHFKVINDSLGHQGGDHTLQVVADRLRSAVRASDTVARFGGDEFVIVATAVERVDDAVCIAETVLSLLTAPILIGEQPVYVRASIGICVAEPGDEVDPQGLLRAADGALYRAKARGRGRYEVVDADSRPEPPPNQLVVERDLRAALAQGDLRLVFQPFVRLEDGAGIGAEALLRWEHPTQGTLAPGDFLEVAEQSGLIVPIGAWMLREACAHAVRWHETRDFLLSVNLSATQLADRGIVEMVERALDETGLQPHCLGLELTEQVLIGDEADALRTLSRLKEVGVLLLLDDFGTGFSSLSHLKRFPIDIVKIDRSFVEGLDAPDGAREDAAIVSALVSMSRATGKQIIPEGIETPVQVDELQRLGCESGQGYFFLPPLQVADFEAWIHGRGAPTTAR